MLSGKTATWFCRKKIKEIIASLFLRGCYIQGTPKNTARKFANFSKATFTWLSSSSSSPLPSSPSPSPSSSSPSQSASAATYCTSPSCVPDLKLCLSPLVTHLTRLARLTRLAARGGDRKYRNKFKSVFIDNSIEKLAKTLHMKRSR